MSFSFGGRKSFRNRLRRLSKKQVGMGLLGAGLVGLGARRMYKKHQGKKAYENFNIPRYVSNAKKLDQDRIKQFTDMYKPKPKAFGRRRRSRRGSRKGSKRSRRSRRGSRKGSKRSKRSKRSRRSRRSRRGSRK